MKKFNNLVYKSNSQPILVNSSTFNADKLRIESQASQDRQKHRLHTTYAEAFSKVIEDVDYRVKCDVNSGYKLIFIDTETITRIIILATHDRRIFDEISLKI